MAVLVDRRYPETTSRQLIDELLDQGRLSRIGLPTMETMGIMGRS
jgi:hypothetical protein